MDKNDFSGYDSMLARLELLSNGGSYEISRAPTTKIEHLEPHTIQYSLDR